MILFVLSFALISAEVPFGKTHCSVFDDCLSVADITALCKPDAASITELPSLETGETHSFLVHTYENEAACDTGGASLRVNLYGPAMLHSDIYDLFNGSYYVKFWTGDTPGEYNITVILDFYQCRGTTNTTHGPPTTEIFLIPIGVFPIRIQSNSRDLGTLDQGFSGYWLENNTAYNKWHPLDAKAFAEIQSFEHLKSLNWIIIKGDSLSTQFEMRFESMLASRLNINESEYLIKDSRKSYGSKCRERVSYFKELGLLLTKLEGGHPPWAMDYEFSHEFECLAPMLKKLKLPADLIPDAIVINMGAHLVEHMRGSELNLTRTLAFYNGFIHRYLKELTLRYGKSMRPKLFWRNTTPILFNRPKLHPSWKDRTPDKVKCLNHYVDKVMNSPQYASRWNLLDAYNLVEGRADCTRDNRHLTRGNCEETLVWDLLYRMKYMEGHVSKTQEVVMDDKWNDEELAEVGLEGIFEIKVSNDTTKKKNGDETNIDETEIETSEENVDVTETRDENGINEIGDESEDETGNDTENSETGDESEDETGNDTENSETGDESEDETGNDTEIGSGNETGDDEIGTGNETGDDEIGSGNETGDDEIGTGNETGDDEIGTGNETGDDEIEDEIGNMIGNDESGDDNEEIEEVLISIRNGDEDYGNPSFRPSEKQKTSETSSSWLQTHAGWTLLFSLFIVISAKYFFRARIPTPRTSAPNEEEIPLVNIHSH